MKEMQVFLPDAATVKSFVSTVTALKGDFELVADGYILDARSLMGIFSFDLTKPIDLRIYNDTTDNIAALQRFAAKQ